MKPLFANIKKGDYQMPQIKLAEYYGEYTDYYKNADNEDVLLKYLECRPMAIILISTKDLEEELEMGGLYKKVIEIVSDNMWANIERHMKGINKNKMVRMRPKKLYLYWLEDDKGVVKCIKSETFEELVSYSRMFLNANTIDFYKRQLPLKDNKCSNVWREFIEKYKKLSLIEQNNIVIISGMVLYLNNIRKCTDLDMLYIKELHIEGDKYDKHEIKIGEDWRIRINKKNLRRGEIIVNPAYYHYYDGIKVTIIDVEMDIRRNRFNTPRAFVDIIMVNLKMKRKYLLPRLDMKDEELEIFYKTMQNVFKKRYNRKYSIDKIKNILITYNV